MKHIRIISPSGVIDPQYIDGAVTRLRAWGYKVSEGVHARAQWGRFAGTDEERLSDLNEALQDESVDVILCSRGGYGLQRIIDRVAPVTKPIIGFSDITALHQLAALSHQPSVHGIMCKHLATLPEDSMPVQALRTALEGGHFYYPLPNHPLNRFGNAEGPIIGGNLSVLYGLQGTRYGLTSIMGNGQWTMDNRPILLIEDIAERHYHIDRMIRNLKMSGVLAQIGGLIVGQFTDCEDDPSILSTNDQRPMTIYETIKEAVAEYDYPVIFDAPTGHVEHNLPLWLNVHSSIHCGADGVQIHNGLQVQLPNQ
ncbi:MAG: LD-carboxypeptidase [Paludibacteraceae bacterium]|nr:LD-carboxypeptidase [Paludibacteraceae bacterium]